MKWIFSLLSLAILSSCSTKPYMVGSVNEMFYKRYRKPGANYTREKERQYDYSWQENFIGTARHPIRFRQNKVRKEVWVEEAPAAAPYTGSK